VPGLWTARHEARFWSFVAVGEEDACWAWLGSFLGERPIFYFDGTSTLAYRIAWGIAWGEMPPVGLKFEHHACGVPWCVNPAHVRPIVARGDSGERWRWLAGWNLRHDRCVNGHAFTDANVVSVPGGRACRRCRYLEELRASRARRRSGRSAGSPGGRAWASTSSRSGG
jgi:hypothetical protein